MGSGFVFTAIANSQHEAKYAVDSAMLKVYSIEKEISSWIPSSQTSQINKKAGKEAVKVSNRLFSLIERSIKVSKISKGYFDISFASINKFWTFDGSEHKMPSKEELKESVKHINYKNIILDTVEQSVFLKDSLMRIGFGAIGKGFAADEAKKLMLRLGANSGVVNAGGDILAWGQKVDSSPWRVGIANPFKKEKVIITLDLKNTALVTSGNYERFLTINGDSYGHIINPKTGMPVKGLASVSILCKSAELADALATTAFVLGEIEGMRLVNHLEGVEAIFISDNNKIFYSKGLSSGIDSYE